MSERYQSLAAVYDEMMSYVPYQNWVDLINRVADEYFLDTRPSIFELGAGTGTLGGMLSYLGYPYQGSDISQSMCEIAWSKGLDNLCVDSRNIPLKTQFDMVIFLFDGINYLTNLSDYTKTFLEVSRLLSTGGLFLFDITTEYNSQQNFDDYHEAESFEKGAYIRHSYYEKEKNLQVNDFEIFVESGEEGGLYHRVHEQHCQTLFGVERVLASIPEELFTVVGVWDDFTQNPANDTSERIHFLLRRCAND